MIYAQFSRMNFEDIYLKSSKIRIKKELVRHKKAGFDHKNEYCFYTFRSLMRILKTQEDKCRRLPDIKNKQING